MAPTQLVAFLFSFCLTVTKGSEPKQLFVQTGSDVTLDIMDPDALKDYIVLQWRFKNSELLLSALKDGTVTAIKERVVYHPQNSSLTVKNLQEEHSGLYQAGITANSVHPPIATYSITVQAPVSPVNLRVDSVSNSSESCNFTVSCTTESSSINASFTCDRHKCEPRPLKPDPGPSLHLYLSDVSVICNHSNHVSWKNDTKDINQLCPLFGSKDPPEETNGTDQTTVVVIVVVTVLVLAISVGAIICWIRPKRGEMEVEDTVYADPQGPSAQPAPATEMMENPTSTYSLVGLHSGPGPGPAPTRAPAQSPPESLYATVNKPQSNPYTLTA